MGAIGTDRSGCLLMMMMMTIGSIDSIVDAVDYYYSMVVGSIVASELRLPTGARQVH